MSSPPRSSEPPQSEAPPSPLSALPSGLPLSNEPRDTDVPLTNSEAAPPRRGASSRSPSSAGRGRRARGSRGSTPSRRAPSEPSSEPASEVLSEPLDFGSDPVEGTPAPVPRNGSSLGPATPRSGLGTNTSAEYRSRTMIWGTTIDVGQFVKTFRCARIALCAPRRLAQRARVARACMQPRRDEPEGAGARGHRPWHGRRLPGSLDLRDAHLPLPSRLCPFASPCAAPAHRPRPSHPGPAAWRLPARLPPSAAQRSSRSSSWTSSKKRSTRSACSTSSTAASARSTSTPRTCVRLTVRKGTAMSAPSTATWYARVSRRLGLRAVPLGWLHALARSLLAPLHRSLIPRPTSLATRASPRPLRGFPRCPHCAGAVPTGDHAADGQRGAGAARGARRRGPLAPPRHAARDGAAVQPGDRNGHARPEPGAHRYPCECQAPGIASPRPELGMAARLVAAARLLRLDAPASHGSQHGALACAAPPPCPRMPLSNAHPPMKSYQPAPAQQSASLPPESSRCTAW